MGKGLLGKIFPHGFEFQINQENQIACTGHHHRTNFLQIKLWCNMLCSLTFKVFGDTLEELKMTDERFSELDTEIRANALKALQTKFRQNLSQDSGWNWTIAAVLAENFEEAEFPPLVVTVR